MRAPRPARRGFTLLGALILATLLVLMLLGTAALARPGGGDSYGGGGGGGGDDGDSGLGLVLDLVLLTFEYPYIGLPLLVLVVGFIIYGTAKGKAMDWSTRQGTLPPVRSATASVPRATFERLRRTDAEFSLVILEDFLYTVYAALQRARGEGKAEDLAAYISPALLARLKDDQGLAEVKGVVVGGMRHVQLTGVDEPDRRLELLVEFEANYTEVPRGGGERRFYVKDRLALSRAPGARSRPPERARTLDCPNCGAPLEAVRDNECSYCHEQVGSGRFDWTVDGIEHLCREPRGPLLRAKVSEAGTSLPTFFDAGTPARLQALQGRDPSFSLEGLQARAAVIFHELQLGWSSLDWMRVRPFVSDNLFQSQLYWIDLFREAGARNVLESARIVAVHLASVWSDKHYDAVTLRIFATGIDYTISDDGQLLRGSKTSERNYSEYWTLIRGAQRTGPSKGDLVCPGCGAPLKIGMAGSCEYCQAKVTRGEFDWVLSRIEQDEAFKG